MLPRHSRTCQTSEKMIWSFWQSMSFLKMIENYFEASKTFQNLPNFRKTIFDPLAIQEAFKNHKELF